MNRYEMVNIINVTWGEGDIARAQEMISEEIVKTGGTLEEVGNMGRRKLAYPINGQTEGIYVLAHFQHSPENLVPLRDNLKLNTAVMRTLLVSYQGQAEIDPALARPETWTRPAPRGSSEAERNDWGEYNPDGDFSGRRNR